MEKIITLLTNEDKDEIRKAIVSICINQMKRDIESWDSYILYPPDFQDIVNEATEQAMNEFSEFIKNDMLEKMKKEYITQRSW